MGQIINLDTWEGELPDALTETGRGGFLSSGYLADRPAKAAVEADETAQFVLTNKKQGVTFESETTEHVTPDSRYRTVAVLTDRRVVVLVGGGDGDEQFEIPMASIVDVETTRGRRNGRVTVVREGGERCHVHTGRDGLDAVEPYLRETAAAWRGVEESLQTVEHKLSRAQRQRESGDYEAALASVRGTEQQLSAAEGAAVDYSTDNRGEPLQRRVAEVQSRSRAAVADIRVAQARAAVETAEQRCENGEYESAQAAYERARDSYDAALRVDELEQAGRIRGERERIDHLVTELRESPLRRAVAADREAVAAEEPDVAAQHWKTALTQYRAALDTDRDDQFTGDPERIRERMVSVGERLTAIQRTIGNDAMQAGDWYSDAGQYEAALTEFEHAAEAFETALSTAHEWYPDATTHLEAEQRAVRQRIERTEATLAGEERVDDRIQTSDEPEYDIEAMVEAIDEPTDIEESIEPPSAAVSAASEPLPEATAARLKALDKEAATDVVSAALDETDWSVRPAARRTPFDLWANRGEVLMGVIVHLPEGDRINKDLVKYCEVVTGAGGTDTVMLATTGELRERDAALAEELGVRLLQKASLAAIVDSSDVHLPAPDRIEEPQ